MPETLTIETSDEAAVLATLISFASAFLNADDPKELAITYATCMEAMHQAGEKVVHGLIDRVYDLARKMDVELLKREDIEVTCEHCECGEPRCCRCGHLKVGNPNVC